MNILTYNTLFRGDMDLKPVPELVDTYENTSDTEWVFHLRQGVKFHDGSEMTADDVVASIEYAKTCPEVNLYNGSVEKIEKVIKCRAHNAFCLVTATRLPFQRRMPMPCPS